MSVISASEMARLERLAVASGASEEAFVLQAGQKVAGIVEKFLEKKAPILLLIGKGNKGADAFAAGSVLLDKGFPIFAFTPFFPKETSVLNREMRDRFLKKGGRILVEPLDFSKYALLIDGLLGTGFKGELEPPLSTLIQEANKTELPIIAIDLPSGLNGDTGEGAELAIQATITVALGAAKAGCFLQHGWRCTGKLLIEDFGLDPKYLSEANLFGSLPDLAKLKKPNRERDLHKYEAGYVIGYGGSKQFSGAPKLTSLAALRSGAGIVRLFYPDEAASNMISSFPELIHGVWNESSWKSEQERASSIFVGPGLMPRSDLPVWFKKNLTKTHLPCVLDAEAMMVDPSYWPKEVVLTPHRGEAKKLLHLKTASDEELLSGCQALADKTKAVIVLKGAPTFVIAPSQVPTIIPYGHPAMATAGSGDVLTGVIAALLAQKLSCFDAALLAAVSHAIAGEKAAETKTSYGLLSSDLIEYLRF